MTLEQITQDPEAKAYSAWPDTAEGWSAMIQRIRVGTLATMSAGSDQYPYEVIKALDTAGTIVVRALTWQIVKGSEEDGSAQYQYFRNKDQNIEVLTRRKTREYFVYRTVGEGAKYGAKWSFGAARRYYDPHV